ncbi:hypothetical protein Trydic_g16490 [Trypoxylus dichotomus]
MFSRELVIFCFLLPLTQCLYMYPRGQGPRCYYGDRGSLTATCENATASYFRSTGYRFDNLDETVRCLRCNLDSIPSNAFDISGNHILYLDLQNSSITSMATSSFVGLVYMETLNLAHNRIKNIVAGTFRGIKKLVWLNIGYNEITILVREGFAELGNLTTLFLNDNAIKSIDANAFNKLSLLEELYLQNNFISSLESVFFGLSSIKIIDMHNNSLSLLRPSDINSTTVLEVNLGQNKLQSLDEGAISAPKLEVLNVSNNEIGAIKEGAFKGCKLLEYINLENNKITQLQQYNFVRLYHLKHVNLAFNNLTILQTSVFTHLPELRYLNVSYNQIKGLQRGGVLPLHNLHSLDISHNQLKYLDYKSLFEHAPRLVLVNLENNSLPCYIVEEMLEFFKEDNIEFSIDDKYGNINETCNATVILKPDDVIPDAETAKLESDAAVVKSSSPNEYIIYSFIFILIGLVAVLFYLQYKTYMQLKGGHQDIAEVGLMSSRGLESRDNEY